MNKVRRLILHKLYNDWIAENKRLQISRFKAGQVLARVARRIQDRLSPKEFQLVSFHLWRRYSSVKNSFRKQEQEKVFMVPYIQRWPRLLRILHSQQIKKKRAAEKADRVTFHRAWGRWKQALERIKEDITDPSQEETSKTHFEEVLKKRILTAWSEITRERGRNMRRRERCFR